MCTTCGCGTGSKTSFLLMDPLHPQNHGAWSPNTLTLAPPPKNTQAQKTIIEVEEDVLSQNNLLAKGNRSYFTGKNILAINLVSSPGSGKTSLLERTLTDLKEKLSFAVIEGDQQTCNDADRIKATGIKVTQINTGTGCHLDSSMVEHALHELNPEINSVLFIENVGNLVCPALFDLGENERVVIISVTEGDDKPLKYPDMFHSSTLCIINKTDLLPYVPFDIEKVKANAKKINPGLEILELSCTSGEGLEAWYNWLLTKVTILKLAHKNDHLILSHVPRNSR